jgi:hypothetical protein
LPAVVLQAVDADDVAQFLHLGQQLLGVAAPIEIESNV